MALHSVQFVEQGEKAVGVGSGHLPPAAILTPALLKLGSGDTECDALLALQHTLTSVSAFGSSHTRQDLVPDLALLKTYLMPP